MLACILSFHIWNLLIPAVAFKVWLQRGMKETGEELLHIMEAVMRYTNTLE